MSEPLIRDAWCGEELYGHTQGWCYCVEIAALRQQLAQQDHALRTMREAQLALAQKGQP